MQYPLEYSFINDNQYVKPHKPRACLLYTSDAADE